jgi:hypothetical protein
LHRFFGFRKPKGIRRTNRDPLSEDQRQCLVLQGIPQLLDKKPVTLPYVKTFMEVPIGDPLLHVDLRGRDASPSIRATTPSNSTPSRPVACSSCARASPSRLNEDPRAPVIAVTNPGLPITPTVGLSFDF